MTVLLVAAATVCLVLAVGGWYDLRHRRRGDLARIAGPYAMRRQARTDVSRWLGPGGP